MDGGAAVMPCAEGVGLCFWRIWMAGGVVRAARCPEASPFSFLNSVRIVPELRSSQTSC